jgi:hypothetical protein
MRRPLPKSNADDPAALENEIQRRLRRATARLFLFDFLFFIVPAIAIFFVI